MRRHGITVAALTLAALLAAGCGSSTGPAGDRIAGHRLTVYLSVPLHGDAAVSGRAIANGAELALADVRGRIGKLRIALRVLDDTSPPRNGWDPGQTTVNARAALADPTAVGYIGEFNSGASAVSIPLLNRGDIPQISPSSSAVGLTSGAAGAEPGEPDKYYPTGIRTFARIVPSDAVQASVQVRLQQRFGCTKSYVVDDGEFDGEAMAGTFQLVARADGLNVVGVQAYQPGATDYSSLASGIAQSGADCVMISALGNASAALVMRQIGTAMPRARLFGTSSVAAPALADPALGGLPAATSSRMLVTMAPLGERALPLAGRDELAAYTRRFGSPDPWALYGYEAMALLLNAVSRSTDRGGGTARRSKIAEAILHTHDRPGVLGTYSITADGDTTQRACGIYRIAHGQFRYWTVFEG